MTACYVALQVTEAPATDYLEVKASCSIVNPENGDYTSSDLRWTELNRSICNFPPGNQDMSPDNGNPFPVNIDYTTADLYPLAEIIGRKPTIAPVTQAFAPFSNSTLTFKVETGNYIYDPQTGNQVAETVEKIYSAYFKVMPPNQFSNPGIDVTSYMLEGRLISPTIFDPKIENGAEAVAIFNGYTGRFTYKVDLDIPPFYTILGEVNDHIQGIFNIVGGGR